METPTPTGPMTVEEAIARAEGIINESHGREIGVCDEEAGWGYAALRALGEAEDQAAVAAAAEGDRKLALLTSTELYAHWHRSRTVPSITDDELKALLRDSNSWYDASGPPRRLALRANGSYELRRIGALGNPESAGRWWVDKGELRLDLESGEQGVEIRRGPYSFELDLGVLGRFKPEPMPGDC